MASVEANVLIARPIEQVFAAAGDRYRRMALLPDNFTDTHLTSEHSEGVGARFSFTVQTDRGGYQSETEIIDWQPPHYFVERTTDDADSYETHWSFTAGADGTVAQARTEYTVSGALPVRLLARLFGRKALQQSLLIELLRLKQALEGGTTPLV